MGAKSEKGNVIELVIIIVLTLAVAGLLVWRFIDTNKNVSVGQDATKQTTEATNTTNTNTTSSSSNGDKIEPNKGYIVIDDWGVRFKPASSEQIQYSKWNNGGDAYSFTTATATKVAGCADSWLWLVDRHTTKDEVANGQILNNGNKIGDYYYYYYHTQEMCAQSSTDQGTIEKQITVVQNLIQTIETKQ